MAAYMKLCVGVREEEVGAGWIWGSMCNTACLLTQHTLYNWTQRSEKICPQAPDYADIWHILSP